MFSLKIVSVREGALICRESQDGWLSLSASQAGSVVDLQKWGVDLAFFVV